jgi:flavodoxin
MLRTLIIYASVHHGNTEKITKVIAETLNCEMLKAENVEVDTLKNYDLIGFGSGIFPGKFKFHQNMVQLIDSLPKQVGKKAFIYSTSGQGNVSYNNPIKSKLEEKGFEILDMFACKGFNTAGPLKLIGGIAKDRPNSDDLKAAKTFAQKLIK